MKIKVKVKSTKAKAKTKNKRELFGDKILKDNIKDSRIRQLYYNQIKSNKLAMYSSLVLALIMMLNGVIDILKGTLDPAPITFLCGSVFAVLSNIEQHNVTRLYDLFCQSLENDFFHEQIYELRKEIERLDEQK